MRSAEEAHHHLERQLARAGGEAPRHARDLRDRAGGRCCEAHADPGARPADRRRHSLRRPSGLARDPLQPEEPAGDRRSADDKNGAAATDAGGAEEDGDRHAVAVYVVPRERGCEYISDLILRSLRSKRLEGWMQGADSRPSFETRARARSSSDNGEAVTRG